jgi:S-(hydroxymethyl)glutathione dehydrogenase/alcohol dehydrogenase
VGAVLNVAKVRAGESVVVVGVGGVGLNAISAARLAGASPIVAIDLFDEKLDKAREFGATHVVNSSKGNPVEEVLALTGGADAVFDFVGHTEVTGQALEMTGLGGGLYLIGVGGLSARLDAPLVEIGRWQRRIQGVLMGATTPKRDIPAYCDLYLSGRLNLDGLISKQISLEEINDGFASLSESSTVRVVVTSF